MATGEDQYSARREHMIQTQIRARGIRDPEVLEAMRIVPRHEFIENQRRSQAYEDHPVPIGHGQTISQPYIVAYMTEALEVERGNRILEVGAGCGYQTAILLELTSKVHSLELLPDLVDLARGNLSKFGYETNGIRNGNGYHGLDEYAPFDRILVAAAAPKIPPLLLNQLNDGGIMIIPIGTDWQELVRVEKKGGGITLQNLMAVRFVPLVP